MPKPVLRVLDGRPTEPLKPPLVYPIEAEPFRGGDGLHLDDALRTAQKTLYDYNVILAGLAEIRRKAIRKRDEDGQRRAEKGMRDIALALLQAAQRVETITHTITGGYNGEQG